MISSPRSSLGDESAGTPVSISATGEPIRFPPFNTIHAETVVHALNGQTVVLGGLITKDKATTERKVPYLADIPVLGHLFRFDSERKRRTELLIIMTPHIIRNEGDAELIKQIESSRMSWCLCDVIDIHGEAGLRSRHDHWDDHETQTIYPDLEIEGEELVPTPAEIPNELIPDGTFEPIDSATPGLNEEAATPVALPSTTAVYHDGAIAPQAYGPQIFRRMRNSAPTTVPLPPVSQ